MTVDPTISVGGNVNFVTPGMPSLPGLTGVGAPAAPTPEPSRVQAKALGLLQAASIPDVPSAPAAPPAVLPAASLYFDRGGQPNAADARTGSASGKSDALDTVAVGVAVPNSAAPSGSSGPNSQQGKNQTSRQAASGLLSIGRLLNISESVPSQPSVLLAEQPGSHAVAPSEAASPVDLAEVVISATL